MEKLQIGPADPVLSFTRTIYNLLSQPIELVKSVHLGDRYKLRIMLNHLLEIYSQRAKFEKNIKSSFFKIILKLLVL